MSESYHSSPSLENPAKGLLDPQEARQAAARAQWKHLLDGDSDVSDGIKVMFSGFAGCIPEAFSDSKRRRASKLSQKLRGQAETLDDVAGPLGRLLVMVGLDRLGFFTLSMIDLGLPQFQNDPSAAIDRRKLKMIRRAAQKLIVGPWCGPVEIGKDGGVHLHALGDIDALEAGVGRRGLVRNLKATGRYICKPLLYKREVAEGYVQTVRAGNKGRRFLSCGLTYRATVREVEAVVGFTVLHSSSVHNTVDENLPEKGANLIIRHGGPTWHKMTAVRTARTSNRPLHIPGVAFAGGVLQADLSAVEAIMRPTEVDTDAALATLPHVAQLPCESPEQMVCGVSTYQPVSGLWEPSAEHEGNDPSRFNSLPVSSQYQHYL